MALASDGTLFTWGDGSYGQLGHSQLQQIAAVMPQVWQGAFPPMASSCKKYALVACMAGAYMVFSLFLSKP